MDFFLGEKKKRFTHLWLWKAHKTETTLFFIYPSETLFSYDRKIPDFPFNLTLSLVIALLFPAFWEQLDSHCQGAALIILEQQISYEWVWSSAKPLPGFLKTWALCNHAACGWVCMSLVICPSPLPSWEFLSCLGNFHQMWQRNGCLKVGMKPPTLYKHVAK